MSTRRRPPITPRKQPRQRRSIALVEDVLEAAVRVLRREGAARFTTVRVAAEAGVSVGSLYQYFPNKQALLFRLQADEWDDTWSLLDELLSDARLPPFERLRNVVVTFFRSERDEGALRTALDDAGAVLRGSREARAHVARVLARARAFVDEAVPDAAPEARAFAADFLCTTMSAIGERITAERRPRAEVDAWAHATADLLVRHIQSLAPRTARGSRLRRRRPAGGRRSRPG